MLKVISLNKISQSLELEGGTAPYLFHRPGGFSEVWIYEFDERDKM